MGRSGNERPGGDFLLSHPVPANDGENACLRNGDQSGPGPSGDTERLLCLASKTAASYVLRRPKEEVADRPLTHAALDAAIRRLERLAAAAWRRHRDTTARAEKILPGLVVLDHLMRRSGHREAVVVEAELPAGLIVDHLARTGALPGAGVSTRSD